MSASLQPQRVKRRFSLWEPHCSLKTGAPRRSLRPSPAQPRSKVLRVTSEKPPSSARCPVPSPALNRSTFVQNAALAALFLPPLEGRVCAYACPVLARARGQTFNQSFKGPTEALAGESTKPATHRPSPLQRKKLLKRTAKLPQSYQI